MAFMNLISAVSAGTAGFAREELLLGTLVVGGLGAFGAGVGLPWKTLLASDETNAAALYREVEAANLKFYQNYGYWPHEVTDGSPAANVLVLMDRAAANQLYISAGRYRPLIEADMQINDGNKEVRHRYGQGGVLREIALEEHDKSGGENGYRYVITMDNLSLEQARKLDEAMDGEFAPETGRLRVTYVGDKAVARYLANPTLNQVADNRS